MMTFKATNNEAVRLRIDCNENVVRGYPDPLINIYVSTQQGVWTNYNSPLTLDDVESIAWWLRRVSEKEAAEGNPEIRSLYFRKSNLAFHFLDACYGRKEIKIELNHEVRPQVPGGDAYFMYCRCADEELKRMAAELDQSVEMIRPVCFPTQAVKEVDNGQLTVDSEAEIISLSTLLA